MKITEMGYPAAYKTPVNVLSAPIARWNILGRRTLVKVLAVLTLLSYYHLSYIKRDNVSWVQDVCSP